MTTYKSIKYNVSGAGLSNIPTSAVTSGTLADARISESSVTQHVTEYNDNKLQANVALLGFKTAVNGSLAKYSLQDQIIDEYVDGSGIDASASTNEYLSGGVYAGQSLVTPTIGGNADSTNTYGDYTLHWFTTTGARTFTTNATQDYEFLIVAGGGSGGRSYGAGGGGAGGLLHNVGGTKVTLTAGVTYTATVGAGGAAQTSSDTSGNSGSDSSFAGSGLTTMTATGGGGGTGTSGVATGIAGGSGGGGDYASGYGGTGSQANSGGLTGYGNNGGRASKSNQTDSGGGGGGAGGMGGYPTLDNAQNHAGQGQTGQELNQSMAGHGGIGLQVNIDGNNYYWAGGGGSGAGTGGASTPGGTGGYGGGGGGAQAHTSGGAGGGNALNAGGAGNTSNVGGAGGANTGGGGGSSGNNAGTGGAGGSGIIVLRRTTTTLADGEDLTLQSTDTTASAVPTKADMVMLMENASGTATLNTDIKGWISRDSGANFTQGTLVDEGDWGTNKKILAFHDLDISSQPSGTSMCYKITTHNQSAGSKVQKIHATSIGWK